MFTPTMFSRGRALPPSAGSLGAAKHPKPIAFPSGLVVYQLFVCLFCFCGGGLPGGSLGPTEVFSPRVVVQDGPAPAPPGAPRRRARPVSRWPRRSPRRKRRRRRRRRHADAGVLLRCLPPGVPAAAAAELRRLHDGPEAAPAAAQRRDLRGRLEDEEVAAVEDGPLHLGLPEQGSRAPVRVRLAAPRALPTRAGRCLRPGVLPPHLPRPPAVHLRHTEEPAGAAGDAPGEPLLPHAPAAACARREGVPGHVAEAAGGAAAAEAHFPRPG